MRSKFGRERFVTIPRHLSGHRVSVDVERLAVAVGGKRRNDRNEAGAEQGLEHFGADLSDLPHPAPVHGSTALGENLSGLLGEQQTVVDAAQSHRATAVTADE